MVFFLIPSLLIFIFGLLNLLGIGANLFMSQLVYGVLAVLAYVVARRIGYKFFRFNITFFYWIFVVMLIVTYVIGLEIKGSKRWIDLYFFSFQGSEFLKVFFVMYLADFFSKNRRFLNHIGLFLQSCVYFIIPAFIIFKQPDLGNALVYVSIFIMMLLYSHTPKRFIFYILAVISFFSPILWFFLKAYQRARIISFLNPNIDQTGQSYNMMQALITVGSGSFLGKGLSNGTQTKLFFLPENHTDFAFSSLVEQFGFVGGAVVIVLYMCIAYMLIRWIMRYFYAKDDEGSYRFLYMVGFLTYFVTQVFVNIGMNIGIMPITGITLPLISYGGSSLVTFMLFLAMIP